MNQPYRSDAINIIIPKWDNNFWPGSVCADLPAEPAACAAYPKDKAIICNPAIGRQLSAPLVQSRIASTQEDFALNFILLTVFGHELGHLRLGGNHAVQHLLRIQSADGEKCYSRRAADGPTEEEKADEIGLTIACTALRNRPDRKELPTDPGDVLFLLSRVEDNLDDAYFAIDDLCTGDASYPSVSRRKIHFASRYLNCLYPTGYEPLKLLNESLVSDFDDLEKWLTARQTSGHAADGNYGIKPLANQMVARAPSEDVSVVFDSTDLDSSLWFITAQANAMLSFIQATSWAQTGTAVAVEQSKDTTRLLIVQNPKDDTALPSLLAVTVRCDKTRCSAKIGSTDLIRDSELVTSMDDSFALVTRTGVQFFSSADQLLGTHGSFQLRDHGFATGPDTLVVAANKRGGIVATRQNGGLYKLALFDGSSTVAKVLVTIPHTTGTLESAAILADRLLLVFTQSPEVGPTTVSLWDCPYESIRQGLDTLSCIAYKAPEAVEMPAALAFHNVSSFSDRYIDPALACGESVVVHHGGWLWLLDRAHQRNDLLFADGIVSCSTEQNTVKTYRARRVDTLRLDMRRTESLEVPLSVIAPTADTSSTK